MLSSDIGGVSVSEQQSDKMLVNFVRAEDYKLVPVTGGWGGVSPQREIVLDFYIDRRTNPVSLEMQLQEGKAIEVNRIPDPQPIERFVHFGVAMRPDIARSIGKFLIEYADKAFAEEEA